MKMYRPTFMSLFLMSVVFLGNAEAKTPTPCEEYATLIQEAQKGNDALNDCKAAGGNCDQIIQIMLKIKSEMERIEPLCKASTR